MSELRERARGHWPMILSALGVDDKYLRKVNGPCPVCGGTDRYRFTDHEGAGMWWCNQCDPSTGDGFMLLQKVHGWTFKQTAKEVENLLPGMQDNKPRERDSADAHKVAEALNRVRREAVPASQVPEVVRYLHNRGLIVPPGLQAHKSLTYWHRDEGDKPYRVGNFPAMLGKVVLPSGKPVTYHRTYLSDGKKAEVPGSAKKVMSKTKERKGGAIQLFPAGEVLGIAEGIETAIAAHILHGIPVWSVMHARGIMEFEVPIGVKKVVVFGDNDSSKTFAGQMAAYTAANRFIEQLKICADVKIPPVPGDWNDELLLKRGST